MSNEASFGIVTAFGARGKIDKERYLDCYGAMRRNLRMKRSGYPDTEIERHWQACINIFGPELLWQCWRDWFAFEVSRQTGIGEWHGWRDPRRLRAWREAYPQWLDVIFPIPF